MSDLQTFKALLRGMAEAQTTEELWIKQAAFMLWCGDNPDKLAELVAAPAAGMDVWQCAEDICTYILRELGHDTDNIDRDEIAAIIRKYRD